jgi:hypothetical protein
MSVTSLAFIPPSRGKWTVEEERELDRIRALCGSYPQIRVECGETDEGDPWCIVYDRVVLRRILLHIARIDRSYFVAWPTQSRSAKSASFASAIDLAEKGLVWEIGVQLKGLR